MLQDDAVPLEPARISIVLPTMNEPGNVERLCQRIRDIRHSYKQIFEAIFVLNNTTDSTERILRDILKESEYQFVRVATSKGARGSAIREGVEMAKGNVIVVIDSDGQYEAGEIPRVVRPIIEDGYGSGGARNHGWANLSRRITSEAFKKLTKILLRLEYVQTGFKAGTKEALLDTIPKAVSGLDIDVRWMNNVIERGYSNKLYNDVEVKLHPRLRGKTTFSPLKLSLGLMCTIVSLAVHRKTGKELPFPAILKRVTLQPEKQATSLTE